MRNLLSSVVGYVGLGLLATSGCASDAGSITGEVRSALSTNVVIAAIFGGGGNSTAPYSHDYVMLFNRGSAAASLNGLSIQYDNATGNFSADSDVVALPNVSLLPGQYFLIELNSNNPVGSPLPTPDLSEPTLGLSNNNGKIALVTAPLDGCGGANDCPTTNIVDLVGYGTASSWEGPAATDAGTSAVPALSNTTSAIRKGGGCTETDDNSLDFEVGAPAPKNTASTAAPCTTTPDAGTGGTDAGTGGSAGSAGAATGGTAGSAAGGSAGAATGGSAGAATGGSGGSPSGGSGGSATGGSSSGGVGALGGFGGSGGKKSAPAEDDGGCGCATPGSNQSPGGLAAILAMAMAMVMRRRPQRDR